MFYKKGHKRIFGLPSSGLFKSFLFDYGPRWAMSGLTSYGSEVNPLSITYILPGNLRTRYRNQIRRVWIIIHVSVVCCYLTKPSSHAFMIWLPVKNFYWSIIGKVSNFSNENIGPILFTLIGPGRVLLIGKSFKQLYSIA